MSESKQKKPKSEMKVLYPGDKIDLEMGITATVYPIGYRHIELFSGELMGAITALSNVSLKRGMTPEEIGKAMLGHLMPYILQNMMALVRETVVLPDDISLDDIPHWDLPPILEQWIITNFGEEKRWRPWIAAIESVIHRFSGHEISILGMVSKPSSPQDTTSPTSSIGDNLDSPTEDGASNSSSSS